MNIFAVNKYKKQVTNKQKKQKTIEPKKNNKLPRLNIALHDYILHINITSFNSKLPKKTSKSPPTIKNKNKHANKTII